MIEDLTWLLGKEWYTEHWIRLWDAKKTHHKGIFDDSKVIINLNEYKSFSFVTRVTQLIHDAGKYQLISVYPLPVYPTHNITHKNGGNLDKLPGWPRPILTQGTLVPYNENEELLSVSLKRHKHRKYDVRLPATSANIANTSVKKMTMIIHK